MPVEISDVPPPSILKDNSILVSFVRRLMRPVLAILYLRQISLSASITASFSAGLPIVIRRQFSSPRVGSKYLTRIPRSRRSRQRAEPDPADLTKIKLAA